MVSSSKPVSGSKPLPPQQAIHRTLNRPRARVQQKRQNSLFKQLKTAITLSYHEAMLLDACARSGVDEVRMILDSDSRINPSTIRDVKLRTPLHVACQRSDQAAAAVVKCLIEHGVDANNGIGDVEDYRPLHLAVLANNVDSVLALLEGGATIPISDPFRLTPLVIVMSRMKLLSLLQKGKLPTTSEFRGEQGLCQLKTITQTLMNHINARYRTQALAAASDSGTHGLSQRFFRPSQLPPSSLAPSTDIAPDALETLTSSLDEMSFTDCNVDEIEDSVNALIRKVNKLIV